MKSGGLLGAVHSAKTPQPETKDTLTKKWPRWISSLKGGSFSLSNTGDTIKKIIIGVYTVRIFVPDDTDAPAPSIVSVILGISIR